MVQVHREPSLRNSSSQSGLQDNSHELQHHATPDYPNFHGFGDGRTILTPDSEGLLADLLSQSQQFKQQPPNSRPVKKLVIGPPRSTSLLGRKQLAAAQSRSLWWDPSGRDIEDIEQQYRKEAEERLQEVEKTSNENPESIDKIEKKGDTEKVEMADSKDGRGVKDDKNALSMQSEPKTTSGENNSLSKAKGGGGNATKNKLNSLNNFVMAHTTRKVKGGWDFVDNKFQSSRTHETITVKDESGLAQKVRQKTIRLHALTLALCSIQVQLNQKQLISLYQGLDVDEDVALNSCKIAARKLVQNAANDSDTIRLCEEEIIELEKHGDPLIRFDRFKDEIFSKDPAKRKIEFQQIEKERTERVNALFEEKKRKREALQKAEARRNKAIYDFENNLGAIQYARGTMTKERLGRLEGLIAYCHRTSIECYLQSLVTVNPAVIELIGEDMFPSFSPEVIVDPFSKEATQEDFLRALKQSGIETTVKRPNSYRIDLVGKPTLVNLLRQTVALGKGLYGMSYSDVVEHLQCYASCYIAAVYRGYCKRWRFQCARRMWKQMYHYMKSKVFLAWRKEIRYSILVRRNCLRKFTAWKFLTSRAVFRRHLFRTCYWSFFVWRRTAVNSGRAREKTKFLVSRVVPTTQMIHVFKAWKSLYIVERGYNRPATAFYKAQKQLKSKYQFGWWRYWTRRRKGIRRAWLKRGFLMKLLKLEESIRVPFHLWAAATAFKRRLRETIKINGYHFRKFLLPGCEPQLPHHAKRIKLSSTNKKKYSSRDEDGSPSGHSKNKKNKKQFKRQVSVEDRTLEKRRACFRRSSTLNDLEKKKMKGMPADLIPKWHKIYKPLPPINWHPDCTDFELRCDEDGDSQSFLTDRVRELYSNFKEVRRDYYKDADFGPDYGFELRKMSKQTKSKIDDMKRRFDDLEVEMFLIKGFQYHRSAHHALLNLRRYAIYHRNARKSKDKYNKRLMKKILDGFVRWANRGIKEDGDSMESARVDITRSEQLAFQYRSERMEKLSRRRAAAQYFKYKDIKIKELEREHNIIEKVETEEKLEPHSRAQQRRFCQAYQRLFPSTKSPTKDHAASKDEEDIEEKATAGNERAAMTRKQQQSSANLFAKELQTPESAMYENVDMLEWDREERDQDLAMMQEMVRHGSTMYKTAGEAALKSAKETAVVEASAKYRKEAITGIMAYETNRTDIAIQREFDYVSEFKIKMARNMVDVLCKIHEEVRYFLLCQEKRQFFRRLRLPLLLKRSLVMVNHKKISNWIRICRRLHAIYVNADYFRSLKTKWIIFNRWLKSFEKDNLDASPGIILMLKHRTKLRGDFSQMLSDRRFKKTCYPRGGRLKHSSHDPHALFLRWKEYTQDEVMFNLVETKAVSFHRLRILQKVFFCLKTHISILESYEERQNQYSYAFIRVRQDCHQISKRYMSRRRRSLSCAIRKYQDKCQLLLKTEGRTAPSFKKFINKTTSEVNERTMLEQILLLDAFEKKGELEHKDIRIRSDQPSVEGMRFAEPKPFRSTAPPCAVKDGVPAGYTLSKIKIAMQSGLGLIGFQCVWAAAGAKTIESRVRGKMFGGGITNAEFVVPSRDFLMDVEYICEGNAMIGIRFKTFFLPWSKWIGNKATPLTKRYLMSANEAKLEPHDAHLEYKSGGIREDMYPGVPPQYIIGFGGVETAARVTCLNIIVRKVTRQHVFSYCWVKSPQEPEEVIDDERPGTGASGLSNNSLPPLPGSKDDALNREELKNQMMSRFNGVDKEDNSDVDVHEVEVENVPLSTSEEQFFDVIRMRSVEVKAAEARALKFGRAIWESMELRHDKELSVMTTINIVTGLTKWLLEGLCKVLVQLPKDKELAEQINSEIHQNNLELEFIANTINVDEMNIKAKKSLATYQPWYGKSLLSPVMRAAKKVFLSELQELMGVMRGHIDIKEKLLMDKEMLRVKSEVHLPHIELTIGVMDNLDKKIKASGYKHKLLENMSLETLKGQLGAANIGNYQFKLSDSSMERIRNGKARLTNTVNQMDIIMKEEAEHGAATAEQERKMQTQQLYGERSSTDLDEEELTAELISMWRPPSRQELYVAKDREFRGEKSEKVLLNEDGSYKTSKKKTFRKSQSVNPVAGQYSSGPKPSRRKPSNQSLTSFMTNRGIIQGTSWQTQTLPPGDVSESFHEENSTGLPRLSLKKVVISRNSGMKSV